MRHQGFNRTFTMLGEYFLYAKKTKITPPHQHSYIAPFWRVSTEHKHHMLFCVSCTTQICCFRSNQSVNKRRKRIRVVRLTQKSIRCLHSVDTLQNGAMVTRRRRIDE